MSDTPELPQIDSICYEFCPMQFKPVQVRFLGVNTDGWLRFRYVESGDFKGVGEYTSCPPSAWGDGFSSTYNGCLAYALRRIAERLDN